MAALVRVLLCLSAAPLAAGSRTRGAGARERHTLKEGSGLQPELVAGLLTKVEDEWKAQAASFVACNGTANSCAGSAQAFQTSCKTVVGAVVKGSSGDRATVADYMGEVCGEAVLEGWKRKHCENVKQALMSFMSADDHDNRENLDVVSLCRSLWQSFSAEEAEVHKHMLEAQAKARVEAAKLAEEEAKAEAKRKEEQAKAAAEEAKKRAEEEAKRQAEQAKRKAEEERLRAEAKKREDEAEAAKQAAEAKREAEEAAARVTIKQQEAAMEAELAQKKMEDARKAALKVKQHASPNQTAAVSASNHAASADASKSPTAARTEAPSASAARARASGPTVASASAAQAGATGTQKAAAAGTSVAKANATKTPSHLTMGTSASEPVARLATKIAVVNSTVAAPVLPNTTKM